MAGELVLVTGGSGFIGAHCILQLLAGGYRVRTTVRSMKREADVRAMLKIAGAEPGEALSFAVAALMDKATSWPAMGSIYFAVDSRGAGILIHADMAQRSAPCKRVTWAVVEGRVP